jgi:prepilin-type N-terminal cleavage/methylation domain-containing protein
VRDLRLHRQESKRAFTLIELLAVIAIIAILTAITFGIVKGVNERAALGQAKAELSVLAQALEEYKRQYGDYPQTGGFAQAAASTSPAITTASAQAKMLNALVGKLGPTAILLKRPGGKTFVNLATLSLETTAMPAIELTPTTQDVTEVANCFLDPWGRRYKYYYRSTTTAWPRNSSYVLYSTGPDGLDTAPASGVVDFTDTKNLDNIYANRN